MKALGKGAGRTLLVFVSVFFAFLPSSLADTRHDINLMINWTGHTIEVDQISALKNLRNALPGVPLVHVINTSYFFRSEKEKRLANTAIQDLSSPIDQYGIEIGGWTNTLKKIPLLAKQNLRNFWDRKWMTLSDCQNTSCDGGVDLEFLNEEQSKMYLQENLEAFSSQGFGKALFVKLATPLWPERILNELRSIENLTLMIPTFGRAGLKRIRASIAWDQEATSWVEPNYNTHCTPTSFDRSLPGTPNTSACLEYTSLGLSSILELQTSLRSLVSQGRSSQTTIVLNALSAPESVPLVIGLIEDLRQFCKDQSCSVSLSPPTKSKEL